MNHSPSQNHGSDLRAVCQITVLAMLAAVLALTLFSGFFPETAPVIRRLTLLILQSVGVSLLLAVPLFNKVLPRPIFSFSPAAEPEQDPQNRPRKRKCPIFLSRFRARVRYWGLCLQRIFLAHRVGAVSTVCFLFLIAVGASIWHLPVLTGLHQPSLPAAVCCSSVFLLFLVLELWCRRERREAVSESRYRVLLGNLHEAAAVIKILFLAAAVLEILPLLGLPNLHRAFYILLQLLLPLQSLCYFILYGIRLLKKELYQNPDLRVFIRGRKKGDLDLLTYLEENTGITMRSLWSMGLVRRFAPWALVAGAVILWLCTGVVSVEPNQQGALYRFGKLSPHTLGPGLHMTFPWPVDSVDVYDTESLKEIIVGYVSDDTTGDNLWTEYHGGEENKLLLGGGNELVSINLRIEYKISDLTDYLRCSNAPEALLESAAYEAVTANTIATNLETLLSLDRVAFSRSFETDLSQRISRYETGLQIVDVVIESIHPPVEVAGIYQEIISAGIKAEKILLDAEAKAAVALEQAQMNYDINVSTASAESYSAISAAKAAVSQFSAGLQADAAYGGYYRSYKYLDALKKAYTGSKLVIISPGIDSSHLYLGKLPS